MTRVREQGGVTSLVDVRQAEQLVYGATAEIATLEREIQQQENFISVLLGANPGPIARGRALTDQPHPPVLPAGLPSSLLERRPDIQQCRAGSWWPRTLRSASPGRRIFHNIALTGIRRIRERRLDGVVHRHQFHLERGGQRGAAGLHGRPHAIAGRGRRGAHAGSDDRVSADHSPGVPGSVRRTRRLPQAPREFREQQELLRGAAQAGRRLAEIRYQGGATSYLEVLDADTRLFDAELGLAQAELGELAALVELYRSVGGGWQS